MDELNNYETSRKVDAGISVDSTGYQSQPINSSRLLALAIIVSAINDRDYAYLDSDNHAFSFRSICEYFNVDAVAVKYRIINSIKENNT
jgi:hypothetical protein